MNIIPRVSHSVQSPSITYHISHQLSSVLTCHSSITLLRPHLLSVMDLTLFLLSSALVAALIALLLKRILFLSRLPPGPWGFPFIGSIVHLNRENALLEFAKYKQKYGPIFSVGIGTSNVIVISDYKLIQEALKLDALNGRPDFEVYKIRSGGVRNRGILFCDANSTWHEQRRFAIRTLRDFGFGKLGMEALLLLELEQLILHIKEETGKPICPRQLFNASVLNSLWHILTGSRFELDNQHFRKLVSMMTMTLQNAFITGPGLFLLAPFKVLKRSFWQKTNVMRAQILSIMEREVAEHELSHTQDINRDFIDAYLSQRQRAESNSSFSSHEGRMNLVVVLKDLFLAGAETTSTTLFWTILYLTQHPQVQLKVQEEIDAVIGQSRLPCRDDRAKLIYVEAVLNEVHRKCSLLPMSVNHKVLEDTEFRGHFFPKGAVVFPNLHEAHHNVEYWKDPHNFRPERFLNETGTALVKHEALMPFSTGKRVCLGETLARDTLFLFFVGLFQTFSWTLDPASANQKLDQVPPTFVISPKDFNVVISLRNTI